MGYPHGGNLLGVSTKGRGTVAKLLAKLDCVTVTQDGSDGLNGTFHIDDFDRVAEIIKPRKDHKGRKRKAAVRRYGAGQPEVASRAKTSLRYWGRLSGFLSELVSELLRAVLGGATFAVGRVQFRE